MRRNSIFLGNPAKQWSFIMRPILFLLALSLLSTPALARPNIRAATGIGYAIGFPDTGGPSPKTPVTLVGVNLGFPLSDTMAFSVEASAVTPNTMTHPQPRITTAVSFKMNSAVWLAVCGFYQFAPSYAGKPVSHFGTIGLNPTVAVTKEISLGLGIGAGMNSDGLPLVVIMPKVALALPF